MKGSNAISGEAANAPQNATPTDDQRSASSPTPAGDVPPGGFSLGGPSVALDPRIHAFRQDLADVALAGRVIASHYAEPLTLQLKVAAALVEKPSGDAIELTKLEPGTEMRVLDLGRGWAWGYVGEMVGYVPARALG